MERSCIDTDYQPLTDGLLGRGRLARAVGAEEAEHLGARDLEGDVVKGDPPAEALRQVTDRDGWLAGRTVHIGYSDQGS